MGLTYRNDLRDLNELNFARFDARVGARIAELRADFRTEVQQVRTDIQRVRPEMQQVRTELYQVRAELLRWMFGFWVTTLIGIAGLAIALR